MSAVSARLMAANPANRLKLARQQVLGAARQLEAMSYRRVLRRGFSVTRSQAGGILRSAGEAIAGELIETELADGKLRSRVASDGEEVAKSANERAKARPGAPRKHSEAGPTLFEGLEGAKE